MQPAEFSLDLHTSGEKRAGSLGFVNAAGELAPAPESATSSRVSLGGRTTSLGSGAFTRGETSVLFQETFRILFCLWAVPGPHFGFP